MQRLKIIQRSENRFEVLIVLVYLRLVGLALSIRFPFLFQSLLRLGFNLRFLPEFFQCFVLVGFLGAALASKHGLRSRATTRSLG